VWCKLEYEAEAAFQATARRSQTARWLTAFGESAGLCRIKSATAQHVARQLGDSLE
jgi:hypothetical protein